MPAMETSCHIHLALSEMPSLTCRAAGDLPPGKDNPEDLPPPGAVGDRTDPWLEIAPQPAPRPL